MSEGYVECPELSGKIIKLVRIYQDEGDGTEMQIDLTDGTSFSCSFCVKPSFEASVIRTGSSVPETLHTYDLSSHSPYSKTE